MPSLSDIKVLDFTHLLPGEVCAAVMCDLGARVVRIESPRKGLAHELPPIVKGESLYYWSLQRDKSRITVNLKSEEGKRLLEKLIPQYDVLIENFRPGVMDRLGLGYDRLRELNDRLIYCSISGYGLNSSRVLEPSHDLNLVAETGVLDLNRRQGERPVLPAVPLSDYMSGFLASISILASLHERLDTGKGRHLDINMFDSCLSAMSVLSSIFLYKEHAGEDAFESGEFSYPRELPNYTTYVCKDGRFLAVASLEPQFWSRFLELIQRHDLLDSIRDQERHDWLRAEIQSVIEKQPLSHWREVFHDSHCCVSPVDSIQEVATRLSKAGSDLFSALEHPELGPVAQLHFPLDRSLRKFDFDTFEKAEDNALHALKEANLSDDEILRLRTSGLIQVGTDKK